MANTKKLPAGIPVVSSTGAVTPTSVAELAKQIGAQLGVQSVRYERTEGGSSGQWYRVATCHYTFSGLLIFKHDWTSGYPAGICLSLNATPYSGGGRASLCQLSGMNGSVGKVRIGYLEKDKFSHLAIDIFMNAGKTNFPEVKVFGLGSFSFKDSLEAVGSDDIIEPVELTVKNMGGGKHFALNVLHKLYEGRAAA